jgi:hypothetical protein
LLRGASILCGLIIEHVLLFSPFFLNYQDKGSREQSISQTNVENFMKKLPEVNLSFDSLFSMLIAPIKSKLMLTGIELKVFNQLSEPSSAEAIAQAIGTHPGNTSLFLDSLAASDLVLKKNGLYQNAWGNCLLPGHRCGILPSKICPSWSRKVLPRLRRKRMWALGTRGHNMPPLW